jgi:cysteine desulfurase
VVFHTDAVQALGKTPFCGVEADIVTVSAHKIHGPKGCGAFAIRKGISVEPVIFGGGQEKNIRSGTENVAGILGFGEAVRIMTENFDARISNVNRVREYLLAGIKAEIKDIKINSVEEVSLKGEVGFCSPGILNVSFLGTRGEVILHGLESEKIYVSTGAACSSNKKGKNNTLAAMGLKDKEIEASLRFSFSEFNTIEEMDFVLVKLKEQVYRFRKLGSFR